MGTTREFALKVITECMFCAQLHNGPEEPGGSLNPHKLCKEKVLRGGSSMPFVNDGIRFARFGPNSRQIRCSATREFH